MLLLALAGFSAALATRADAGAVGTVTVNSVSNTDDTVCNGPPNDNAVGNCTFREAINDVNNGLADTIKFHPAVFSKAAPGVIDLETVGGDLPPITREVTIDNTGTAVVVDCDADNDQSWGCGDGLRIEASHNGFDFTLIGGKQFTIREIGNGQDGIHFNGDEAVCTVGGFCSFGDINISGVNINVNDNETDADGGDAIDIDSAANISHLVITNSILEGDDGTSDEAIEIDVEGNSSNYLTNNNIEITNNRLYGGDGVDIEVDGDLYSPAGLNGAGHTFNIDIYENESITGNAGNGVEVDYCIGGGDCNARGSTINVDVTDNGKISGNDDDEGEGGGIFIDMQAIETGCVPSCNDNVTMNVDVDGNAIIDGDDDDGVNVSTEICCATSDSVSVTNVTGNLDIVGDDDGVEIDAEVNEGPDNLVEANVDDNGEIVGEGAEGVDIDVHAGTSVPSDTDSDENTARVSVSRNEDISGDNQEGVQIDASSGKQGGPGDADRNTTEVKVNDNGKVEGGGSEEGVELDARAGTADGPGDADDNIVEVEVNGNGSIDSAGNDGLEVDAIAGHTFETPIANVTGDGNSTKITVDGNESIKGHEGDGADLDSRAGGLAPTGQDNSTKTVVTNNGVIKGGQGGGDGLEIDVDVCCDPDGRNTNTIDVSDNEDIIGQDEDGIDITLCCSLNTVSITDNTGVIKGNEDNGIELSSCLSNGEPGDPTSINFGTTAIDDLPCMADTVTVLTITGNNISNSGQDGILICCGAFQFPLNQAPAGVAGVALKSVIADNTISHNGEDGIDLDTTMGINVTHNDVFLNGTSATDGDNGVEIDWQFAWTIWDGAGVKVPAHFNRISENSIYDNAGLGINLIGISSVDPLITDPGSGTESSITNGTDGVGCFQFPATPIGPNDCIPYPKVLFTGGPTVAKVSGSSCANCIVEVFVADPTPADQLGPLGRQHGEGKTFLVSVHADALGAFSVNLPCGLAAGQLTATATDKLKNTSEFASNIPFPGTPACAAATALPTDTPAPAQPTNTPVPPANTPVPPAPTDTPGPAGLCGDVNSDGLANSIDASLILQKSAGLIDALPKGDGAGDVNVDGMTNAVDATLILQSAAAMIAGLGC